MKKILDKLIRWWKQHSDCCSLCQTTSRPFFPLFFFKIKEFCYCGPRCLVVLSHFLIAFYRALLSKRRHPSHYLILSHGEVEKSRNLLSSSSSLAYIITKSAVLKFRQSESIWYWCGRFVFKSLYPPQRWWWQSSAVWLMLQHELMLLSFIYYTQRELNRPVTSISRGNTESNHNNK